MCRFAAVLHSIVHNDVGILCASRPLLVFFSWYAAYYFFMFLTVKYGLVSKFTICHTFPFRSVIILGLLLEIDIVVKTCGLKYAVLPNPLLGKGSTQPYYKNGSCVSAVHNRENGSKA